MALGKGAAFYLATVTKVRDGCASCDVKFFLPTEPPRSKVPVGTLRLLSDGGGAALLHAAATHGACATLEELLTRGRIPVCTVAPGTCRGALHFAVEHGRAKCVEILLNHGAVATCADAGGTTALDLAKAGNDPDVVALVAPLPGDLDVRAELQGGDGTGSRTIASARVMPLDARPCGGAGGMTAEMWAARNGGSLEGLLTHDVVGARSLNGWTPLHFAAGAGNTAAVNALLAAGATVDAKGTGGVTPLWAAARNGHNDTVVALLDGGATQTLDCGTGRGTALCAAAEWGWVDVVETLLQNLSRGHGLFGEVAAWAQLRATIRGSEDVGRAGATALVLASAEGHVAVVRALLGFGASASSEAVAEQQAFVDHRTEDETTALLAASRAGHVKVVRELLTTGCAGTEVGSVKFDGCDGATAVFVACAGGHTAVVEALLEAGADLDARLTSGIGEGLTVLAAASSHGHVATVEVVLAAAQRRWGHEDAQFRAFLDAQLTGGIFKGYNALLAVCAEASRNGDPVGVVRQLLNAGADPHAALTSRATQGFGALHFACWVGHARELVEVLLDAGIPVDVPLTNWFASGLTPLMFVVHHGRSELVELFLERGADVNAPFTRGPFWGNTPLITASIMGHTPMVRRLLDAGARVHARHWLGGTAEWWARLTKGHDDVVALLRAHGAESVWRARARVWPKVVLLSPFILVALASQLCWHACGM